MAPLSKLAWWKENDPATLRETPRWGGVKELVLAELADAPFQVDLSLASGIGPLRHPPQALGSPRRSRWPAYGRRSSPRSCRPPSRLRLRGEIAAAAGLPADTPLIIGAADGPLANLGVGATPAGVAAVSLGTSGALRTIVDRPTADEAGRLFCYALTEDRWAIGGAVNNAGSVVRWAGQSFAGGFERPGAEGEDADERDAALLIEAQGAPPGSDGLLCLPYLLGERAPWWRPGLRGAYLGLRREHGRAHLVRAAVEGVCQQFGAGPRLVRGRGIRGHRGAGHRRRGRLRAVGRACWRRRWTCRWRSPTPRRAPRSGPACWGCTRSASCPTSTRRRR